MTSAITPQALEFDSLDLTLPDHTELPDSDGKFVFAERAGGKNLQEHPQSILLTDSIAPILKQRHPERVEKAEALLARYRERFRELPES